MNNTTLPAMDAETREAFFAQYSRQECLYNSKKYEPVAFSYEEVQREYENLSVFYALLTPLHLITDEDAIEVVNLNAPGRLEKWYPEGFKIRRNHEYPEGLFFDHTGPDGFLQCLVRLYLRSGYPTLFTCGDTDNLNVASIDYLRSRGYALSFRHYSVEDLCSMGVLKLKEQ